MVKSVFIYKVKKISVEKVFLLTYDIFITGIEYLKNCMLETLEDNDGNSEALSSFWKRKKVTGY